MHVDTRSSTPNLKSPSGPTTPDKIKLLLEETFFLRQPRSQTYLPSSSPFSTRQTLITIKAPVHRKPPWPPSPPKEF